MHRDIYPVIFYKQNGFTLPLPLSWLKAPWADQGCFTPKLKRLCSEWVSLASCWGPIAASELGEGRNSIVGIHCLETVQVFAIRLPCPDLQVKHPHRALLLFKVTQEESVKHSDCVTKYWEMGISEREIECSPLVVFALEQENKRVLPVWYFLCLEW